MPVEVANTISSVGTFFGGVGWVAVSGYCDRDYSALGCRHQLLKLNYL